MSAGPQMPRRGVWERLPGVVRGVLVVALLLVTAVDALVTALVGVRPLQPRLRRVGRVLADEYRRGRAAAIDIEAIGDEREVRW